MRIHLSVILIERSSGLCNRKGSGSWLAMSTNDRYVPFFVENPSILGDKSTLFSILVEVLADEESSVGARAPLSASV